MNEMYAIAALDLEPIKAKLMHRQSGEGWTLERANAVEFEYRRFLYLMKRYPNEQTAPLVDVDTFWHYHILDTMKYAADCEAVFGRFLHHFPYIGLRGEDDEQAHERVGQRMQELYEMTFGDDYLRGATAHSGAIQASHAHSGAISAATAHSGAISAATAHSGAISAATAHSGAISAATAHSGAISAATAHSGAISAATAHSGAISAATAHSGAVSAATAHSGAIQASHAHSGAMPADLLPFYTERPRAARAV